MLYEAAAGYALFEALDADEVAQNTERMQEAITCASLRARCTAHLPAAARPAALRPRAARHAPPTCG